MSIRFLGIDMTVENNCVFSKQIAVWWENFV